MAQRVFSTLGLEKSRAFHPEAIKGHDVSPATVRTASFAWGTGNELFD